MPVNGLVTMTPTSIVSAGTGSSSSINTNGSVTFTSCTSLSMNGVFTSSYDNYMIVCRSNNTGAAQSFLYFRFRLSGTDATGTNYVRQYLSSEAGTKISARDTGTGMQISPSSNSQRDGFTAYLFGPALAQATALHATAVNGDSSNPLYEVVATHSVATAYDGITIFPINFALTGRITVYGFNQ